MFELHVLGGLRLEGPTGPITGRAAQRKRLAVLARLALARGVPLTRDSLCGLLWAESSDEQARQSLSAALYDLRRVLGEAALPAAGESVRLDPSLVGCDAVAFEEAVDAGHLEMALSLYRGAFLEGVFLGAESTEEWEKWLDAERARLARRYSTVLERLADASQAAGDVTGEVEARLRQAREDPYGGRTTLRLMQALERAGEGAQAIQQARLYATRMREELDAVPDPAVMELEERLRREPTPTTSPARVDPLPPTVNQVAPAPSGASLPGTPATGSGLPETGGPAPPRSALSDARDAGLERTAAGNARMPLTVLSGAAIGILIGAVSSVILVMPLYRGTTSEPPPPRAIASILVVAGLLLLAAFVVLASIGIARLRGRADPLAPPPWRRTAWPGAGAGFALGVGVALMGAYALAPGDPGALGRGVASRPGAPAMARGARRVAVAPFANLTGDASLEPLSRMTADWVIRGVMALKGIEVADFWARARSDGSPEALRALAQRSGANIVVSGNYYRDSSDVLLVARISDVAAGKVLRELGPVRIPRDEAVNGVERVRALVTGALAVHFDNPEGALAHSPDPPPTMEAYAAYLEGSKAFDGGDFVKARLSLEHALALDTSFLNPLWLLATIATDRGQCATVDSIADRVERRRTAATELLVLHVTSVRALCHHDRETEYQAARRLVQLMPGSEAARQRVIHAAMVSGRLREAADGFARVDPTRPPSSTFPWHFVQYSHVLHLLGRYDDEVREAERGRRQFPSFAPRFFAGLHGLAALNRTAALRARADEARLHGPVDWPVADVYRRIAHELAYHGYPESSRTFARLGLSELDRMTPAQQHATEGRVLRILLQGQLGEWKSANRLASGFPLRGQVEAIAFGGIYVTDGFIMALRGITAAKSGNRAEARAVLDTLGTMPVPRLESPGSCRELYQAGVLAALGERASARRLLRQARDRSALPASDPELLHYDVMLLDLWHDPELDRTFGPRD